MTEYVKSIAIEKAIKRGIVSPVAGEIRRANHPDLGLGYWVTLTPANPCKSNCFESLFVSDEEILSPDNELLQVFTAAEAGEIWGLSQATVRNACLQGRFLPGEARKSEKTWLVTRTGMLRLYGAPPR